MTDPAEPTPREVLLDALEPLLPTAWLLDATETAGDDIDVTRLRISQRSIARHPQAGARVHLVGFTLTITVPTVEFGPAEEQLDDDMNAFIFALDTLDIAWTTAEKGLYDGRLGYQLTVSVSAFRKEE